MTTKTKKQLIDEVELLHRRIAELEEAEAIRGALEEAENKREDYLRGILQNINSGVAVYEAVNDGEDFLLKDLNWTGENIDRVKKEEVIGKKITEAYPGVKRFGLFDVLQRVFRSGNPESHPVSFYDDERIAGWRDTFVYKLPIGHLITIYDDVTTSKQIEEELIESEKRFKTIFENANDEIIYLDESGIVINVNNRVEDIFGYKPNEIIGRNYNEFDFIDSKAKKELTQLFARLLNGEYVPLKTFKVRRKDGDTVIVELNPCRLDLGTGEKGILVIVRDVTERNLTEEALKASEEKFRTLVENSPDFICIADSKGKVLFINKTLPQHTQEDIIDKTVYDFTLPEFHDVLRETIAKVFDTGYEGRFETKATGPDDSISHYETRCFPLKRDGNIDMFIGISTDITERKQAEETIGEKAFLLDSSSAIIGTCDLDGIMTYANSAFLNQLGFTKLDDILGRQFTEFWMVEDQYEEIMKTLTGDMEQGRWTGELKMKRKNDSLFDVHVSAALVVDRSGKPIALMSTSIDITRTKRAEEALQDESLLIEEYINSLPGLFYVFDEQRFIRWNKEWNTVTGYNNEEIASKYGPDFFEGEDRILIEESMLKVFHDGTAHAEAELVTKNGERLPYYFTGICKSFNGKDYLIGLGIDVSDRKQAKIALQQSNYMMDTIFSTTSFQLALLDRYFNFIHVNKAYADVCKYPQEYFIGKNHFDLYPHGENEAIFQRVVDTGESFSISAKPFVFPDQSELGTTYWDWSLIPVKDAQNMVTGLVFSLQDVTAKQQAQMALVETQQHLESIIDAMPIILWSTDSAGQINMAVGSGLRSLGLQDNEHVGQSIYDLYVDNPHVLNAIELAMKGELSEIDVEVGGRKWINHYQQIHGKKGSVIGIAGISIDITERKETEEKLRESEEKYRLLFETMVNGFAVLELIYDDSGKALDCRYTELNPAHEKLTGMITNEIMGRTLKECIPDFDHALIETYENVEKTGQPAHFETYVEGLQRWFDVSVYRTQPGFVTVVFENITEIKQDALQKELNMKILNILNSSEVWKDSIEGILTEIKEFTGFDAVAIRMREGEDFPYYVTKGFPSYFVEAERYLCTYDRNGEIIRDSEGKPYVECMCGNVICERTDPDRDFFTRGGSFWSNHTSRLLTETTDEDRQTRTRNRCNGEGYESVALVPLKAGNETLGLIQFNDTRTHRFTKELIEYFESLGNTIGIAFSHRMVQKALSNSEERYRTVADFTYDWETWIDENGKWIYVSPACERITGFTSDQLASNPELFMTIVQPDDLELVRKHFSDTPGFDAPDSAHIDFRITNMDNETRWISHMCQPVYDSNGIYRGRRGSNRDVTQRLAAENNLKESLNYKATLLREIHHRVKNNLQVMTSLLSLQSRNIGDKEVREQLIASQNRIRSMAMVHEKLYATDDLENIRLDDYIQSMISELCGLYAINREHVMLDMKVGHILLPISNSIPCGVILNELITNAFRHAFPDGNIGHVGVSMVKLPDDLIELTVLDNGIGVPDDLDIMETESLGLKLVRILTLDQLNGTIELERAKGTKFTIRFREVSK